MNVRKQAKKVFAIGTSFAIAASTLVGALAYDLSDYPAPFVEDGVFNGAVVIGADAAAQDTLGAIDIAASLQAASKSAVASGSSTVSVEGGEDFDELNLGDAALAFDNKLDANDLDGFVDSDFDFNDEDIDYEDYIVLADGAIAFYGAQNNAPYDEDFGMDIYGVITDTEKINYTVEMEAFDWHLLGSGTNDLDDEIEFKFLGKTITITDFPSATSATIEASNEYYLEQGDSVTIDGHEIVLKKVGENAVLVSVDGQSLSISDDETEEFDQADDFEVKVESFFYIEGATDNSATLQLGESISDTVDSGDSLELFGEPSDEDEADWLWDISMNTTDGAPSYISAVLNIERTSIDADEDDERNALALGESIELPNNYAAIEFAALEETSFTTLTVEVDDDFDLREDNSDGGDRVSNAWGFRFSTDSGAEDFIVSGTKTEEVWAIYNGTSTAYEPQLWYEDGDDEVKATAGLLAFTLRTDDENVAFTISSNSTNGLFSYNMTFPGTSEIIGQNASFGNDYFGNEDDEESIDLRFGTNNVGSADYDGGYLMTNYGAYTENPEDQFGSGNTFEIVIPDERQRVTVIVRGEGSVVSAGSTGGSSYAVNTIALGLGILDTDAPALGSKPMVVVGGPYVNDLAADLLDNPTPEQIGETFSDGKAMIRWFDNEQAMLVAGWSAQDTLGAAYVVSRYEDYDFSGNELEVVVTSLDNIKVNSVN